MDETTRAQLRERLRRLGVRRGTAHLRPPVSREPRRQQATLAAILGGEEVVNQVGAFHLRQVSCPPDQVHGRHPLGRILGAPTAALLRLLHTGPGETIPITRIAYLDTETTGLAGGTGTPAFLVGLGTVDPTGVRVRQYFLRDLDEEPAMLAHLAEDLVRAGVRVVVTYNGRAFDLPILTSRYVLNAIPSPLEDLHHLDLLQPTRRLWRPRIRHCSLSDVEQQVLEHRRQEEDVPGWLVPIIYRDYLCTGDPAPLRRVFYHNLHDVLSLIALTDVVLRAWHDPWDEPALVPADFVARARLLLAEDRVEEAEAALRHALRHPLPAPIQRRAYQHLGALLKRQERWTEAVRLWETWASTDGTGDLTPFEELAKYYEWRARDLPQAYRWTLAAQERLGHLPLPHRLRWQDALAHRRRRLERRLGIPRRPETC